MGATLSTETTFTAVVLAGALGVGYHQYKTSSTDAAGSPDTPSARKSKKKKKKAPEAVDSQPSPQQSTSNLVRAPSAIPGQFDETPPSAASSKPKKAKKKAKQSNEVAPQTPAPTKPPVSTPIQRPQSQQPPTASIDTDGSWTRVESRRKAARGGGPAAIDLSTTSDAGITSSVTGNSSPVDGESTSGQQTLAEKLVPKPPQTEVDDMLPEHPTLSRVMRIRPLPDEKPAPGFSWDDYEDVHIADGGENDADGEDDGWGVVKSKRPRALPREIPVSEKVPETLSKKQRQNAKKHEAQKAAKVVAEAERVATLAKHKRELERTRIIEQAQPNKKGKISGGMKALVDEQGKLVWE